MINDSIDDNISDNEKLSRSQFAMVAMGVGEMMGGLFVGKIIDTFSSKAAVIANVAIIAVMTIVSVAFIAIDKYNVLAFVMTFMWGFQDSAINTHTGQMLGFEFDSNVEPYSVFNMVQAVGVFSFQFIESEVDTP